MGEGVLQGGAASPNHDLGGEGHELADLSSD
jgi:hypothetical protein